MEIRAGLCPPRRLPRSFQRCISRKGVPFFSARSGARSFFRTLDNRVRKRRRPAKLFSALPDWTEGLPRPGGGSPMRAFFHTPRHQEPLPRFSCSRHPRRGSGRKGPQQRPPLSESASGFSFPPGCSHGRKESLRSMRKSKDGRSRAFRAPRPKCSG